MKIDFDTLQKEFNQMNRLQLLEFIEKVNKVFKDPLPEGTGDQYRGFKACFETLKREIYDQN